MVCGDGALGRWLDYGGGALIKGIFFIIVQSPMCPTLRDPHELQASLPLTISQSLPKFMSIELVMPFKHLILCSSLLLLP